MSEDQEKQEEKIFPLEKILTISADDYAKLKDRTGMRGKCIRDYTPYGVQCVLKYRADVTNVELQEVDALERFAKKVPPEAEIVVGYRSTVSYGSDRFVWSAEGTALIKKKSEE
jgi:hypothetical protein